MKKRNFEVESDNDITNFKIHKKTLFQQINK